MSTMLRRREFLSQCGLGLTALASAPSLARQNFAAPTTKSTGYIYDPAFPGYYQNSAETPDRVKWIHSRLEQSSVFSSLKTVTPVNDPIPWILKVHSAEHLSYVQRIQSAGDSYQPVGPIAEKAVAGVLGAVRDVCSGTLRNAFCCIRPPGHHVQDTFAPLGYCFYANVVIAARYAQQKLGLDKILIIDWDYHQGNGTHGHLCENDGVLFFETYNPPMYSTLCNDFNPIGPNAPIPANAMRINIHMPSGSNNSDFVSVFERKLVPAAERFKPQLILISCGFDLKKYDTHTSFEVTAEGISRLTKIVMDIADAHAQGRVVSMLEGGYADTIRDLNGIGPTYYGLAQCAENHVKTLVTGQIQPETELYLPSSMMAKRVHPSPSRQESARSRRRFDAQGRVMRSDPKRAEIARRLRRTFFGR